MRIRSPHAWWIALLVASAAASCASRTAVSDRGPADAPFTLTWDSTVAHAAAQRSNPSLGEHVYVKVVPKVIRKAAPIYPVVAAHKRITGTVIVQAFVLANGRVGDTRVVRSIPELDRAAIACVRRWRFKPAVGDHGRPIAVWVSAPVTFKLP